MKLKELLKDITVLECTADPELEIENVYYDSRKVTAGSLFVAVSGFASDGNRFIPMALEKGAAGCLCSRVPETLQRGKFYVQVADTAVALRDLSGHYRARFDIPVVQVCGSGLELRCMTREQLVISGRIDSVTLKRRERP